MKVIIDKIFEEHRNLRQISIRPLSTGQGGCFKEAYREAASSKSVIELAFLKMYGYGQSTTHWFQKCSFYAVTQTKSERPVHPWRTIPCYQTA